MPERENATRTGAVKWRTVRLKNGKSVRVAVVPKKSPRVRTAAATKGRH